jgi:hypothetical protein
MLFTPDWTRSRPGTATRIECTLRLLCRRTHRNIDPESFTKFNLKTASNRCLDFLNRRARDLFFSEVSEQALHLALPFRHFRARRACNSWYVGSPLLIVCSRQVVERRALSGIAQVANNPNLWQRREQQQGRCQQYAVVQAAMKSLHTSKTVSSQRPCKCASQIFSIFFLASSDCGLSAATKSRSTYVPSLAGTPCSSSVPGTSSTAQSFGSTWCFTMGVFMAADVPHDYPCTRQATRCLGR